jgi:heparan-alpha-glucosaminide N-acetyltransferase
METSVKAEGNEKSALAAGAAKVGRMASVDVYRGFVMFLMLAEVLRFRKVAEALPASGFWQFLAAQQTHVEWRWASLHDLIQPSFSFLVGVALPFSLASRRARGQDPMELCGHAFWRAFLLIALGVFLRSTAGPRTQFTFEDTLSQIGLGYGLLFLIGQRPMRDRWIALGVLLTGVWVAFAWYPLPGPEFDYAKVGVGPEWPHLLSGFSAHWNKNSNVAWAFDVWFLNLFPRTAPFLFNKGGYCTLSFLPTLGTMLLGTFAGEWLRTDSSPAWKLRRLFWAGVVGVVLGALLDGLGWCPVVKRIWTPSWTLFSGGWCFLMMAGFYALVDVAGYRRWSFPLMVIGANSIAAYCMDHLWGGFFFKTLKIHFGSEVFKILGAPYEPFLQGLAVFAIFWGILFWMYRRGLFLKI